MIDYVRDQTGRIIKIDPRDLPVLINGDDIYFKTNPIFYEYWLDQIKVAGFTLSLGKNYVHPNTFTINSRCFVQKEEELTEVTYLNVGLLQG